MPANYVPNPAALHATITCPIDSDPPNASATTTPLHELADNQARLQQGLDAMDFQNGITVHGGSATQAAVVVTGGGLHAGTRSTGGPGGADGVQGVGTTDGASQAGVGVSAQGNANRAALHLVPQAAPVGGYDAEGDVYVDSAAHKLKVFLSGAWGALAFLDRAQNWIQQTFSATAGSGLDGATGNGDGAGAGLKGFGGTTNGNGLEGVGGGNGAGVSGAGAGTGAGGNFTGGIGGGRGVHGTGLVNGEGVRGDGAGAGHGVVGVAGGTGKGGNFVGGINGDGAAGSASGTGNGLRGTVTGSGAGVLGDASGSTATGPAAVGVRGKASPGDGVGLMSGGAGVQGEASTGISAAPGVRAVGSVDRAPLSVTQLAAQPAHGEVGDIAAWPDGSGNMYLWYCVTAGSPGTWFQLARGLAAP
jgi:hypothetical protein